MKAKIYPDVKLGKNVKIGEFVIIGEPLRDGKQAETIIGDDALIRSHTVIYSGNKIGKNFQTGHHVNIREYNNIKDNVSIGTKSVIEHHVVIEDDVRIHTGVFIPEFSVLKKGCWIGPHAVLTNAPYPLGKDVKNRLKAPMIEEGAKIGANSTILPGVRIGKNALVGAGSVVTKDVKAESVVAGNPAREIKKVSELKYKEDLAKAY